MSSDGTNGDTRRVAYLIGAGGSHACLQAQDPSRRGILMKDLTTELAEKIKGGIQSRPQDKPLVQLVNEMADDDKHIDVEHLITFYEESPSALHKNFAEVLRAAFHAVLRKRLKAIKKDIGVRRVSLYERLFRLHDDSHSKISNETLRGILTLNYDDFLEEAARRVWGRKDADLDFQDPGDRPHTPLLKLHGSFSWRPDWPLRRRKGNEKPLWIPPGIQKRKDRYPFNVVWGMARDVLNCDVLRVIGCRLGANDWDLISLIFSTHHANRDGHKPYTIEIIDSPKHASQLKRDYPYLKIQSLFDIETHNLGQKFVSGFTGGGLQNYEDLDESQKKELLEQEDNWFKLWLEEMYESLGLDNPRDEEALRS